MTVQINGPVSYETLTGLYHEALEELRAWREAREVTAERDEARAEVARLRVELEEVSTFGLGFVKAAENLHGRVETLESALRRIGTGILCTENCTAYLDAHNALSPEGPAEPSTVDKVLAQLAGSRAEVDRLQRAMELCANEDCGHARSEHCGPATAPPFATDAGGCEIGIEIDVGWRRCSCHAFKEPSDG